MTRSVSISEPRGTNFRRKGDFSKNLKPLSLAVAAALAPLAGTAVAQEGATIEQIVVTGFRQSLLNSMATKRNSELIVEAISAEDIGKLPDNSIAEALTRLTGLAGQRLNGRQQVISIRGLAPDFSTALLNGRQQVSAGDNRGVEFDQYPSELLQGVVVYKTPDASLTGQGLAGTVDMRTVSPLDYDERVVVVNARYEMNEYSALNPELDDAGWRYTGSYIDQNADGTVGVALGFSHIGSPSQREVIDIWDYNDYNGAQGITGINPKAQSGELTRDSFMAVLEFQPNERVTSTIDVYRSSFEESSLSRQYELPLYPAWFSWNTGVNLANEQVNNGLITSGTFNSAKAVISNNLESRDADLWAAGWNLEFDVNDDWDVTADISHSAVDRQDVILSLNTGTGPSGQGATDTIGFVIGNHAPRFTSSADVLSPGATVLTSPMGWGNPAIPGGQVGYDNRPSIEDELTQIKLSAERYLGGAISSVDFGVQFDSRTKSRNASNQGFLGLTSGELTQDFTPTGAVTVPFGLATIATFDPVALYDSGIYYRADHFGGGVLSNDWTVDEDVTVAYVKFNIESSLGDVPVTGNFGVQAVRTDQSSSGSSAANGGWPPPSSAAEATTLQTVTGGADYTEYLPSLNLNFEIADAQYIRLGIARTLARARMDEMRAGREVNFNASLADSTDINQAPWGGSGGSPDLRPWMADSIDLSYELYFPDATGYFALATFYKDLTTYIYEQPRLVDFAGFPTGGVTPALTTGIVSRPSNGDGGNISGYELSLQVAGEALNPALEGFGAVFNGSWTDSEIERGTGDPSTPLPGLSDTVMNLTLYYERGGFSARISGNHRSDFLGEVQGFGAGRTLRSISEEQLVDAQLSYSFEGGQLDGLTLYLQGTNLTDEPFVGFLNNDHRMVKDWQSYGATYFVGASYRF